MSEIKSLHFHLPKTGGSALRTFFVEQLGEAEVTPPLQGMMLSEALLHWPQAAVISGHFIAKQGDVISADRVAITVLREPVDRFLSEYFYNKSDVDHQLVDVHQRAGDIDSYIQYLSTCPAESAMAQMEMLYPLGTDAQRRLTVDEKLASAIQAIDRFDLVGIQEELDDFCSMLCAQFRFPATQPRQTNVTSQRMHRNDLTAQQRRAIEQMLAPEIELYAHAYARFQQDRRRFITVGCPKADDAAKTSLQEAANHPGQVQTIESAPSDFGDRRCEIGHIEAIGRISGPGQAMTGEMVDVVFHIVAHEMVDELTIGIALKDERGSLAFGTNSNLLGDAYSVTPGKYVVKFSFLNRLGPGNFFIDGALTRKSSHYDGCFHWRHAAAKLNVHAYATQHFEGRVLLDVDVEVNGSSSEAVWCRKRPEHTNIVARAFGNSSRELTDFRCSLDLMSPIDIADRNSDVLIQIRMVNSGSETWRSGGRYPVRLSYRWLTKQGETLVADGLRSELTCDIAPGGAAVALLHVRTPDQPREALLVVSLVQENVAWFVDRDQANGRVLHVSIT